MKNNIIEIKNLCKSFCVGKGNIPVLQDISWQVGRGSWTALLGASGSGKTTLLNLIGMLESADSGEIYFDGEAYSAIGSRRAAKFRNSKFGFVFQSYYLFPEMTLLENVAFPGLLNRARRRDVQQKARELLEKVGLKDRITHKPKELSGGEQQRAAIARALINAPELILADEPTGNLDSVTGGAILDLFSELHDSGRIKTIIMITHDTKVAELANARAELADGHIATT